MSIHLMVIGKRSVEHRRPNDDEIDAVVGIVNRIPETRESSFIVRRCCFPSDIVQIVRRVAIEHGKIETLDLYDHGAPGRQRMGHEILFNSDELNLDIARALRPLLAEHARVRLLGCETAWGVRGRKMLLDLRNAFDQNQRVVVYGTIALVNASEFGATGFTRKHLEEIYLVSSTEVSNEKVRTIEERSELDIQWKQAQSVLLGNDAPNPDCEV